MPPDYDPQKRAFVDVKNFLEDFFLHLGMKNGILIHSTRGTVMREIRKTRERIRLRIWPVTPEAKYEAYLMKQLRE